MPSFMRILLTVVIVIAFTLASWVGGGMAFIILTSGMTDPPSGRFLAVLLPVTGVVLGLVVSAKVFGGKPRK